MSSHVVVGASVAAMAAAERLAANGEYVRWLVTGPTGGPFAPMTVDGRRVGHGLRRIEHDDRVADHLDGLLPDLRPAPTPRLVLGERIVEDMTLTGRVSAVTRLLDDRTLHRIAEELVEIRGTSSPGGVLDAPGPIGMSLHQASRQNHGELFHRIVVEPIASALVPGGAAAVEATQRHKVWAPLYRPETLLRAVTGVEPDDDSGRHFRVDRHGGLSDTVSVLEARLDESPNAERVDVGRLVGLTNVGAQTELTFASGHVEHARRPMLATPPAETFAAAGIPHHADRVEMSFLWLDVEEADVLEPTPTTFLDDDILFRVCSSTPEPDAAGTPRRTFSVELRRGAPPDARHAVRAMIRAGMIAERARPSVLAHHRTPAFEVPSAANRHAFDHARSDLCDALPATRFLGELAAEVATDPFIDQLISGLRAAEEVSGAHV